MTDKIEFGLDTFGDVTMGPDGALLPQAQVIRNLVDEAVLADSLGVDFIGVGEHHRDDFAVSSPETVLAAIAARTERIRLGSAVTVLSSDDPIRVFQRFSTVDALSNGRAEVILGRGSFTESFPLFGFRLSDYETLFTEKLDLFAALLKGGPVTWQGSIRPPLKDQNIYPPVESGTLRTWVGVGGSPESVVRAARYGHAAERMLRQLYTLPDGGFGPYRDDDEDDWDEWDEDEDGETGVPYGPRLLLLGDADFRHPDNRFCIALPGEDDVIDWVVFSATAHEHVNAGKARDSGLWPDGTPYDPNDPYYSCPRLRYFAQTHPPPE